LLSVILIVTSTRCNRPNQSLHKPTFQL